MSKKRETIEITIDDRKDNELENEEQYDEMTQIFTSISELEVRK